MINSKYERLQAYREAERAILEGGQSYRIGNRTVTRADLKDIRATIAALESEGADVERAGRRALHVIFHE